MRVSKRQLRKIIREEKARLTESPAYEIDPATLAKMMEFLNEDWAVGLCMDVEEDRAVMARELVDRWGL